MIRYTTAPADFLMIGDQKLASFVNAGSTNIHRAAVESFGQEWHRFADFSPAEVERVGSEYFDIVAPDMLADAVVLDLGCGTGRWAKYLAPHVRFIECVDPSEAVYVAARVTADCGNVRVTHAGVDDLPFADESFDFIMSIGVLHHVPDPEAALRAVVRKLKPGGWFLLYLYYDLEGRPLYYRALHSASEVLRQRISRLPFPIKAAVCDVIAWTIYMPFIAFAAILKRVGPRDAWRQAPLNYYLGKSIHFIRTDALDRFGTPLEHRFSRATIEAMMRHASLTNLIFSDEMPKWHALGRKV